MMKKSVCRIVRSGFLRASLVFLIAASPVATVLPGPNDSDNSDEPLMPVQPEGHALVMRSYVDHPGGRRFDGVFVGDRADVHYALDLEQASLLHAWSGPFLDMEHPWTGRGMKPGSRLLAHPEILGSPVTFSGLPGLARLEEPEQPWPESGDGLQRRGYALGEKGRPTFLYRFGDVEIEDRLRPAEGRRGLVREMRFRGEVGDTVWTLLADGERIEPRPEGYFRIDDRYFVKVTGGGTDPVLRRVDGRDDLIAPVHLEGGEAELRWKIIW